ncbi:MAG: hypothetical protein PHP06_06030 [Clostridia bacterium]|nr:hypothetical protein [Clostridia bacterium]
MNYKKTLSIALIIVLYANVASAAFFIPWLQPNNQQPTKDEKFNNLYKQVILPLNTAQNINLVSPYMKEARYNTIKIHVADYNKDLYVISGQGTTLIQPAQIDKTYSLSAQQISWGASILKDGKIDRIEKWQLYMMLRLVVDQQNDLKQNS